MVLKSHLWSPHMHGPTTECHSMYFCPFWGRLRPRMLHQTHPQKMLPVSCRKPYRGPRSQEVMKSLSISTIVLTTRRVRKKSKQDPEPDIGEKYLVAHCLPLLEIMMHFRPETQSTARANPCGTNKQHNSLKTIPPTRSACSCQIYMARRPRPSSSPMLS